jgi:alcohol dehydrogenase class IV
MLNRLGSEADLIGGTRLLVLTSSGKRNYAAAMTALLGAKVVGIFDRAEMHVPVDTMREACALALKLDVNCTVAIGGGSAIGLAKTIALQLGIPILAIPTTYAGSEMTTIYGLTQGGSKTTGRDARVLPRTVIYDPDLTLSLPVALSATSGMNAIAHGVEALYAGDGNPIVSMIAEEGIRAMGRGLLGLSDASDAKAARSESLYGAWLCGLALNGSSMGLHHQLCHVLGGSFNLPHADTHAIVLPYVVAYNTAAAPAAMARTARALEANDAAAGVYSLGLQLGIPRSLKDIGMPIDGLDKVADLVLAKPYPNPAAITRTAIRRLLQDAYDGINPSA